MTVLVLSGGSSKAPPAQALLARARLPSGAVRSDTEPSGDAGLLSTQSTSEARADAARAHAWWIVPGRPGAVLRAITGAAKRDLHAYVTSQGASWPLLGPPMESEILELPPAPGAAARQLVVAAVGLPDGSTGVRIDANVGKRHLGWTAYAPLRVRWP